MRTSPYRSWLVRMGGVGAVLGGLLAGVGNLLHPVTPRDDLQGVARVIADSDAWTPIHLIIVAGLIAMLVGLIGLRELLPSDGKAGSLAEIGLYLAVVGTVLGVATVILDGVAAKQLADAWATAPQAERAVLLRIVGANETQDFALAAAFNATFAGLPFVSYGLAIVTSGAIRPSFGWVGAAAGLMSVGAGAFQALSGRPTVASLILTIIGPSVIALWMIVVGVVLWRRAASPRSVDADSVAPALVLERRP